MLLPRRSTLGAGMVQPKTADPYKALGMLGQALIGQLKSPVESPGMGSGESGVEGLISPVAPSSANPSGGLDALTGQYTTEPTDSLTPKRKEATLIELLRGIR